MKFVIAKKNGPHGLLLVVTDAHLLGKKFEEGKLQLDLSRQFYQGEEININKEEIVDILKTAQHVHLTGKEAVALGITTGMIERKKVLIIQGVPHAEGVAG